MQRRQFQQFNFRIIWNSIPTSGEEYFPYVYLPSFSSAFLNLSATIFQPLSNSAQDVETTPPDLFAYRRPSFRVSNAEVWPDRDMFISSTMKRIVAESVISPINYILIKPEVS